MDVSAAHKYFSAACFNEVWDLLDKKTRTAEEDRLMREMAHASLFHWLRREDAEATNLSIGLWQVSRVHAVLGEGSAAGRYGAECLAISEENDLPPFYIGYGHEAAARAAKISGDGGKVSLHLASAETMAEKVEDEGERRALLADLNELRE